MDPTEEDQVKRRLEHKLEKLQRHVEHVAGAALQVLASMEDNPRGLDVLVAMERDVDLLLTKFDH